MIITRKELHDQVWSRPMTKVAADYGVTSTALKKSCTRHEIPTPDRGYWAKLEHGKPVTAKTGLPPASAPHLETVEIVGVVTPKLPSAVIAAEAAARARMGQDGSSSLQSISEPSILVPTRRAISKARPDQAGFASIEGKGLVRLTIAPVSLERSLSFIARLLTAAEAQGFVPHAGDDGLVLVVDGERIMFAVEEQIEKAPHVQTAEDKRQLAEHQRWGWPVPRLRKYDHLPSGRLALLINANPYGGLRRKFVDRRTKTLETMIPDILVSLAAHAALIRERRREAEEAHKRQLEAEARRRLQEAFESREKEREAFVNALHAQLLERAKLSSVLGHLDALPVEGADQLAGTRSWVKRRLAMIDALIGAGGLDLTARAAELDFSEPKDPEERGKVRYYSRFQDLQLWSRVGEDARATTQTPYEWANAWENEVAPPGENRQVGDN
jgi:hypothetical protein